MPCAKVKKRHEMVWDSQEALRSVCVSGRGGAGEDGLPGGGVGKIDGDQFVKG